MFYHFGNDSYVSKRYNFANIDLRSNDLTSKTLSSISGLLTFFILIAFVISSVFVQILVLNGASESQAFNAISISLICQSVGLFPAIILARWLPNFVIKKFHWNTFLAVIIAVIAAVGLGMVTAIISVIVSILLAGIH